MKLEKYKIRNVPLCYAILCYDGSTLLNIKLESNKDFKDMVAH